MSAALVSFTAGRQQAHGLQCLPATTDRRPITTGGLYLGGPAARAGATLTAVHGKGEKAECRETGHNQQHDEDGRQQCCVVVVVVVVVVVIVVVVGSFLIEIVIVADRLFCNDRQPTSNQRGNTT